MLFVKKKIHIVLRSDQHIFAKMPGGGGALPGKQCTDA